MFNDFYSKYSSEISNNTMNNRINTFYYYSNKRSNVTNLGTFSDRASLCSGLADFNDSIKSSIRYMYLNNNNITDDLDVLTKFNSLLILNVQCNAGLKSLNGLQNNKSIAHLISGYCNINTLSGLSGVTNLAKIILTSNSNLTSLNGIDDCLKLDCIMADNCNLSNINSLENHSNIYYLNLNNNVDLVDVKYIQHCKKLTYIYLIYNTNMDTVSVDIALNGTDSSIGETVLISQCVNGTSGIPKQYWDLFDSSSTILDFSYATLGTYLTDTSAKWVKLKSRTDLLQLNLSNQTQLSAQSIVNTLGNLTNLRALNLYGMSNVTNVSFLGNLVNLREVDLRGISRTVTNLSPLNNCYAIRCIGIDNYNIDLTSFETAIGRVSSDFSGYPWGGWFGGATDNGYIQNGLWVFCEAGHTYDFSGLDTIECISVRGSGGTGKIDLTGMANLKVFRAYTSGWEIKVPTTIERLEITNVLIDASAITGKFSVITREWSGAYMNKLFGSLADGSDKLVSLSIAHGWFGFSCITDYYNKFKGLKLIEMCSGYTTGGPTGSTIGLQNINSLETFQMDSPLITFTEGSFPTSLLNVEIYRGTFGSISFLKNCINLKSCLLYSNKINSISELSNLTNIEVLNLSNNLISDISSLAQLKKLTYLNLSTNSITNLSPLLQTVGENGKIGYSHLDISSNPLDGYTVVNNVKILLQLHSLGLNTVNMSGTNFSENEINDLINGKTIDGVFYSGFGNGKVTY